MSAAVPALRVARPTNELEAQLHFYRDALGLAELYRFGGHAGFDGVMLGYPGAPWHLELTVAHGHVAPRSPTPEHLLVLYLPDREPWESVAARMRAHGHVSVPSFNPFWDASGLTFEDPDGYRIVLQNAAWTR